MLCSEWLSRHRPGRDSSSKFGWAFLLRIAHGLLRGCLWAGDALATSLMTMFTSEAIIGGPPIG
eukprot:7311539-Alexandrium_andersonii.AAC.1